MYTELIETFISFQKLPKGCHINDPEKLIVVQATIPEKILKILGVNNEYVYFTRRSLKHLAEKEIEGKKLFYLIPLVLELPDEVRHSGILRRFMFLGFDLLWRTEATLKSATVPPSAYSSSLTNRTNAGGRSEFSALREDQRPKYTL